MKRDENTVAEILERHVPLATDEQVEAAAERVRSVLQHAKHQPLSRASLDDLVAKRSIWRRPIPVFAAAAVILLAVVYGIYRERQTDEIAGRGMSDWIFGRPQSRPSFDVVSIRVNLSGRDGGGISPRGNFFNATNVTLRSLVNFAYWPPGGRLFSRSQIIGGPDWMDTDRFEVQARVEGDRQVPPEQMRLMVQSMLEDRFRLRAHLETRELPVYHLVLIKNGPRLSADQSPPNSRDSFITFGTEGAESTLPRGAGRITESPSSTTIVGTALTIPSLVNFLRGGVDRVIIDKTEFTGLFDVNLQFSKDEVAVAAAGESAPSIFAAIQELGLKLESARAPLNVVVIESVQKPSEN